MTIAEEENITKKLTEETNELIFEPGYAGYLRSQGYNVDDISDIDTIQSESDPEKKYLVAKITTYEYPKNHAELDAIEHQIELPVCTCWNWRSEHSANLEEEKPTECGTCKHLQDAYRAEKAKADESQDTLI